MNQSESLVPPLSRFQQIVIGIAGLGIAFGLIGAATNVDRFFQVYLVAYLFWVEIALGCLGFLMVQNIVTAKWTYATSRIMAAGARTLPLMAVLFIPLLLGMGRLYPWANDPELQTFYLTPGGFIIRNIIYFAVWIFLAYTITNLSYRNDEENNPALAARAKQLSVIGIVVFFIIGTLAAIDWAMSLTPDWFSGIFGWLAIVRQAMIALALGVYLFLRYSDRDDLKPFAIPRVMVDLGGLLLATLLGWIYLSYMQYFVMWSGNLVAKVSWFDPRTSGTWGGFMLLVTLLHVVILVLLMLPGLKKIRIVLSGIALALIALRLLELFWFVMPTFDAQVTLVVWDFGLPVAVGGLWIVAFLWSLEKHRLLSVNHPELPNALDTQEEPRSYETT